MSRSRSRLAQQPLVVARVQADARLVEDVQHADQAAADLPGEADALGLAAGERRGGAVERQVVQADVEQEAEPAADLLEQLAGDRSVCDRRQRRSRTVVEPRHQVADRHVRRASTSVLPPTRTARACGLSRWPSQAGQRTTRMYFSSCIRRGPAAVFLNCASSCGTMPSHLPPCFQTVAAALLPLPGDVPVAAAVRSQSLVLLRQLLPRRLQVDAERLGDALVDVLAATGPCRLSGPTSGIAPS